MKNLPTLARAAGSDALAKAAGVNWPGLLRAALMCAALVCFASGGEAFAQEPAGGASGPGTVSGYMDEFKLGTYINAGATELFKYMAYLVPIAFALIVGWKVVKSLRRV